MTRKEIDKFLDNTKVYVAGKSKEIQEKLFQIGYKWELSNDKVSNMKAPFFFLDKNKQITWGDDMQMFTMHKFREITAEEILSLELTEPVYRPFKNIEEFWNEALKHEPFGWIMGSVKYHLIISFDDIHISLDGRIYYTFEEAFTTYKFVDGTPFGIKED